MDETRKCPYCGEEIRTEALRCRYCRSHLAALDPERWHRDHPERRVAGVATAVARAFALPVGAARLGFIVLTFFHLLGAMLYGALWLIIPFAPGEESLFERGLAQLQNSVARLRGERRAPSPVGLGDGIDSAGASGSASVPASPHP